MKIYRYLKRHPWGFLAVSLSILCLVYLFQISHTRYRLNNWYEAYIDKNQTGLRVFYYPDMDLIGKSEDRGITKKVSYSGSTHKEFQKNDFSLRVAGFFSPPGPSHYKLFLRSDDGSRLYIDNKLVIDNFSVHPSQEIYKTIFFKEKPYLVVIEYFQSKGKAELDFGWLETGDTERSNDLGSLFHPVVASFNPETDIDRFRQIDKHKEDVSTALLFIGYAAGIIWIFLRFGGRIYEIWSVIMAGFIIFFKRHNLLCAVILLVIVLGINFYPILFEGKTLVSDSRSPHVQDPGGPFWEIEPYAYLNHYYNFDIKAVPLWNPYEGTGLPLAAMLHTGSFSPFGFLVSLYPSHLTMNFLMFLRLFIAGLFMYLFLREIKISSFAAFIGGCYFMLAPPHIACINQFQMDTVPFIPAILYFLERALLYYRRKDWILVSIFIALAFLGGNPEECFLVMSLVTLYFFTRVFFVRPSSARRSGVNYFIAVMLGLCLAGFLLLPAAENYMNSQIVGRSYSGGERLNLGIWIHILFPPKIPQRPPSTLNINIITIFLILITLINLRSIRRFNRRYLLFSLIYIFIFLSMMFNNTFTWGIKMLPLISHIWWSKYTSTIYIALAVIVGIGLNLLSELKGRDKNTRFIFIVFALAVFLAYVTRYSPVREEYKDNPAVFYYISLLAVFLLVSFKRNILYTGLVGFLFLTDIFLSIPDSTTPRPGSLTYPNSIVYLRKLTENAPFRVHPVGAASVLEPNRNCIYQLSIIDHSGVLKPKRFDEFSRFIGIRGTYFDLLRRYLDFLGIKYIYGNRGPLSGKGLREVYNEGNDYIYENKAAFPRAFIVHRAEEMFNTDDILKRLADPDFDLRYSIIIEKDLPDDMLICNGAPLKDNSYTQFIKYSPNEIMIKAYMENDGFLVLSDTYYPGWKAYADGRISEVYLCDFLIRAIYLDKGEHLVRFVYRPFTFFAGLTMSFIALVCLIIIYYRD